MIDQCIPELKLTTNNQASFCAMNLQHARGIPLDVKLYHTAVKAMNDDYDIVRAEAIMIIWY